VLLPLKVDVLAVVGPARLRRLEPHQRRAAHDVVDGQGELPRSLRLRQKKRQAEWKYEFSVQASNDIATCRSIVGSMALSARNQLRGRVKEVNLGGVMGHIVVQVGENEIESVITRRSVEEMKLQAGDEVTVVIKSTEVMIQK
jgi:molybdopterin-binding protein